jgi:hypothetical protein
MLDTFVIFKNLPKVDKHPNGRKFAQSGHPVAKKKEGEKKKKEFFEATKRPEKKTCNPKFRLEAQKNLSENATFQWHKKLPVVNSFQICSHPTHPPF